VIIPVEAVTILVIVLVTIAVLAARWIATWLAFLLWWFFVGRKWQI
jgi:hypothetical protein